MWIRLLPYAGWPLALFVGWLWIGAKEDLATEIERCNTDKMAAVAAAEKVTRETLQAAHDRKVAELVRQAESANRAREIADEEQDRATSGTAQRDETITILMLEASIDDIPDSKECLNVFALNSSLDGFHVQSADCGETSAGASAGPDGVCVSTEGIDRANSTSGYFSDVTYGDTLKLWGHDRDTIQILNGQLQAIESLGKEAEQ